MPVSIIDTLKPKNGGSFPIVEAIDVFVENYGNLAEAVSHFATDVMIEAINTVLSGKANTSDVNASVANLQAQINQLITPVTQDAEVQNARVGDTGTSYQTLKERLDSEYDLQTSYTDGCLDRKSLWLLYNALNLATVSNINYIERAEVESGKYYDSARTIADNATYTIIKSRIPIKKNITYYWQYIHAYFSYAIYENGTTVRLSDSSSVAASGTFTAAHDGYVIISMLSNRYTAKNCIFTDSAEMNSNNTYYSYYTPLFAPKGTAKDATARKNYFDIIDALRIVESVNINYIENSETETGKYYNSPTTTADNVQFFISHTKIPIKKNVKYYWRYLQAYFSYVYYDDGTIARLNDDSTETTNGEYTALDNGYILISGLVARLNANNCIFTDSKEMYDNSTYHSYYANNTDVSYTTISIYPDGTGDYATLKEAFEAIYYLASFNNRYIVEFHGDGTEYDITSEFASITQSTLGLWIPPFTTFKGIGGKEKNILVARLDSENTNFSPINIFGTTNLEGLTIIAKNCRYAVHDDYNSAGAERIIENCDFISEGCTYKRPYGSGVRSGNKWIFKNCRFICDTNEGSSDEFAFSLHNNIEFEESPYIEFDNCRFTQSHATRAIIFSNIITNANGIINNVCIKGCKITTEGGGIYLIENDAETTGRGNLFKLSGYANVDMPVRYALTDGVDYSSYVDMI